MREIKRPIEKENVVPELRRSKRTKTSQGLVEAARFANQHQHIYGTQHFQMRYTDGFTMLQLKYTQATSFLAAKMKQEKNHVL